MAPRLKSLELQGYKTFASRMLLEFPADITAVVGPNGAGKSNVADAIRWVLGEQSYSLLRGRKTEDMIFAGSEQRPRASMASVTITFDNGDGWLPIDYSEVAITRRAYRDGQNEYLLNGQKVRLKEIGELLAQSGLAERTYTMIGQGLVDSALSLKPDERRRFFEEAAGIGLYRSRREEAINRLDSTQRNLERIKDILSELEPRLNSLERQAKRAQEYERIKADLQLLLRDWSGDHWHRSQREIGQTREVHRAQEQRVEQARIRLENSEKSLEGARTRLHHIRGELNRWHSESSENHRQREQISRRLAVLDERQRSVLDQQNTLQTDLRRLEEEFQTGEEKLAALKVEQERLQADLKEAQAQSQAAQKTLSQRQIEREQADRMLREARKTLVNNETRQVTLKAHQDELRNRLQNINASIGAIRETLEKSTKLVADLEAKTRHAGRLREQAELDESDAGEEIQTLRQKINDLDGQRKQMQDARGKLETQAAKLRAQIDVLEQAERSFSGLNQGARFVLQSAKQGQLKGTFQPLNSLLDVPAEIETAIAAVLGEFLDGVVLQADADPENALVLLESGEKGRAVLFPAAQAKPAEKSTFPVTSGVLGNAAELVTAPEHLYPVLNMLLGQVLVVRDRQAARSIMNEIPSSVKIVTLRGEVFGGNGVVIAGTDGRAGMIARPRQKRELQDALVNFEDQFDQTDRVLTELEEQINRLRADEQRRSKEQQQLRQRLVDATKTFQQAKLELDQAKQRGEFQKKQQVDLDAQVKKTQEEIERDNHNLLEVVKTIQDATEQVRQRSRILAECSLDEIQAQVTHWNTNAAVAARAAKDAESRVNEYQQLQSNNFRQRQSLRSRLDNNGLSMSELEREKNELRVQENALNQIIETLQEKIEPAEAELERLELEYSALQEGQSSAQQAVSVAERHLSQAQLDLTRQREALDNLRRKIEDDFGLVAFEYSDQVEGQSPLPLGEMVSQLPVIAEISVELEENINRQRSLLRRMGAINPDALAEYQSVSERYAFLVTQVDDLKQADLDLRQVIAELDDLMKREFRKTFDAVATEFKQMFTRMFGGGSARLILTDEDHPTQTGIDIEARLPGRREQGLSLLSGGERSLTAVALIFALLKVSPTPFCVMDEVDAALDEANVGRFCELLDELSDNSQFVVITHNRNTVQTADVIYGVTMGRDSASQLISLKLDEVGEDMVR